MSDMSESDDEPMGIVGSLEYLLKDLKDTQARVTKLLATERRAHHDDHSVRATLLELRKKVVSVRKGLDEVEFPPSVKPGKIGKEAKRERAEAEEERERAEAEEEDEGKNDENEDSGEDAAEGDHDASHAKSDDNVPVKMVMRTPPAMHVPNVVAPKPKLILDGMTTRLSDCLLDFERARCNKEALEMSCSEFARTPLEHILVEEDVLQKEDAPPADGGEMVLSGGDANSACVGPVDDGSGVDVLQGSI